ncbi:MAG: TIR domain-containing protein [Candidatus Lokiarchaeota archaeon]|nr:TIR domain-containing protein [Candidatus Lokiarchaeota archaeon]
MHIFLEILLSKEIFISYSRRDEKLCDQIFKLLSEHLEYEVFVDRNMAAGPKWKNELKKNLESKIKPDVILLATKNAANKPDEIIREIKIAQKCQLNIIPIEFHTGSVERLLKSKDINFIPINQFDTEISETQLKILEKRLRVSLHRKVQEELEKFRDKAERWADSLLTRLENDFWAGEWQGYIPPDSKDSVALTAQGGSGKSVIIANFTRDFLSNISNFPIVVDADLLRGGAEEIAKILGARVLPELPEHIEQMQNHLNIHIIFIIDGLDRISIPEDPGQERIIKTIKNLTSAARTVVGCRKVNWDTTYAHRLNINELQVKTLSQTRVHKIIQKSSKCQYNIDFENKLLQVPLFLDLTLRKIEYWGNIPETETDFLRKIRKDILVSKPVGPANEQNAVEIILNSLSLIQIDSLNYEVPIHELQCKAKLGQHFYVALDHLEEQRFIQKKSTTKSQTIRLVHDLIDDFGMVLQLLENSKLRQKLYKNFEKDCGRSVMASLILAAYDLEKNELVEEIFKEILWILDRKPLKNESIMARTWAATDVLKIRFEELLEYILKCLDGEKIVQIPELTSVYTPSNLNNPRITQATASTLASVWLGINRGKLIDVPKVIPVLEKGLYKWDLRARFIEALAKYDHPNASAAIITFAYRELQKSGEKRDPEVLRYVAVALRNYNNDDSIELLNKIQKDESLKPSIRRIAKESYNYCLFGSYVPSDREEKEIIDGLKIRDGKNRYSDWRIIQDQAEYVRRIALSKNRSFSANVINALVAALNHEHTDARRPIVECLGTFDKPEARDALLNELLKEIVPPSVRNACLSALKEQLTRCSSPSESQNHRVLLIHAANQATSLGSHIIALDLLSLAIDSQIRKPEDWLIDEHTAEVVNAFNEKAHIFIKQRPETEVPLEPSIVGQLRDDDFKAAGPPLETKYRFTSFQQLKNGDLKAEVAKTTWNLGKSFHNVLLNTPQRFSIKNIGFWFTPIPLGRIQLPGIAVVHVIVLTSDLKLLLAKRSDNAGYAPAHWSISFEEQISEKDFRNDPNEVVINASIRGFYEEFGIKVSSSDICPLSALIEIDTFNLGLVMLIQCKSTFDEIHYRWSSEPRPEHHFEATELQSLKVSADNIQAIISGFIGPKPLHPTSIMRLAMLSRFLRHNPRYKVLNE